MYFPQLGFTRDKADEPDPSAANSGPANFLDSSPGCCDHPHSAPRRAVELGKRRPRV